MRAGLCHVSTDCSEGGDVPEVESIVVQADCELTELDAKRGGIRELGRHRERDASRGVVAGQLEVGDGDVGERVDAGQRKILGERQVVRRRDETKGDSFDVLGPEAPGEGLLRDEV